MSELIYKILLATLVISMNLIRLHYQRRYKKIHAHVEKAVSEKHEKALMGFMTLMLEGTGMLWLFSPWLSFGQFYLPDAVRLVGFAVGACGGFTGYTNVWATTGVRFSKSAGSIRWSFRERTNGYVIRCIPT
jgi:hypothetical protein